jgi:hypothetical protein
MSIPRLCLIDRDATINLASSDPTSPLYYITELDHLVIKPNVVTALAIIRAHGVPTILVTKQRCIDKGLISRERVDLIHARLQRILGHVFDEIRIEVQAENKRSLYDNVLNQHSRVAPQDVHLFDDSADERIIAARMGITAWDGADLYSAVTKAFGVR